MEIGDLVYINERLTSSGIRTGQLVEVVAKLENEELVVQPLNPITCEPVGVLQGVAKFECRPIVNANRKPATKSEWLTAPWEL